VFIDISNFLRVCARREKKQIPTQPEKTSDMVYMVYAPPTHAALNKARRRLVFTNKGDDMNRVRLEPNGEQLKAYTEAMFKHASKGTIVSLLAIYEQGEAFAIKTVPIGDDLSEAAIRLARRTANTRRSSVFCLPLATFSEFPALNKGKPINRSIMEAGLVEGLALSFDLDWNPSAGRDKLERVLGPATVVVASGGVWLDPETGRLEPKLHMHWRLRVPARRQLELQQLREARELLAALVDGDPVARFVWYPLRAPGSWHLKDEPVLCRVLEVNKHEISLQHLRHICKMPDGLLESVLEGDLLR
jgi:hypothetical protein